MWHKGGLRFVNVYIDMCNYLHTESLMCTIVFIWFCLQISAHICTKVLISWDSVRGKNNPDQNILDRTGCFCRTTTNKHANYRFHVNVNQTWWLTGWCDGWRRTSSLNSKVLWMSTTCETSPGKVRKSHFAPPQHTHTKKVNLTALSLKFSSTRQVQERTHRLRCQRLEKAAIHLWIYVV